jgi:molybdopterin-guanine dinucleotide biosynthesis protein
MRVVSVCGIRGSGKTTLIRKLIALLSERGKRTGVIVNEDGEEGYPQDFIETHGTRTAQICGEDPLS